MAEKHQPAGCRAARYKITFPEPASHYLTVEARFGPTGSNEVSLFLPVWTPGSYLVREYARNIEPVSASGHFRKTSKNRWRIEAAAGEELVFTYRVYCREMSVRTNWVEDAFALINGAPTFVTLTEALAGPHEVEFELPARWKSIVTALPQTVPGFFRAANYDELVDSPILCGNSIIYRFDVDGIPHTLANEGEHGLWDSARAAADTERIVRHYGAMWGGLPYENYTFLNLLTESSGGLEHRNSCTLMASRWATRTHKGYLRWLHLVSHEFFHVWNVKRLRPVELGPFDYENENYTRSLWVAEGITTYYGPLGVRRAGLSTPEEYLAELSEEIQRLQTTPGRLVQSAEESSWDAWIKLDRPDENSGNSTISYYTKGAVVAWLLDSRIREATNGEKSLDHVMRAAFARFAGEKGFTTEEFKRLCCEVAGMRLDDFFRTAVESTEELDYAQALDWFGLRFKSPEVSRNAAPVIGCATKTEHGRIVVTKVPRDTPAAHAGIGVDDEIIAIDDFRVRADHLSKRLECYRPGDRVSVLLARREVLMRVDVTLGEEPKPWTLEFRPDANETQKRNAAAWIGL
jgi:predicted metalloprotease with PDZ domain